MPATYAFQAFDAAMLIDSAVKALHGKLDDPMAMPRALLKADFKSLRGPLAFSPNGFPIQNFYLTKVSSGRTASSRPRSCRRSTRTSSTITPGTARCTDVSTTLLAVQALNGLQLGVLLFLVAAGLTLVFGVMDFVNMAHGVQYMLGAYLAVAAASATGSFLLGLAAAAAGTVVFGLVLDRLVFRHLYGRGHLDQVLATFGIILTANEAVRMVWGNDPLPCRSRRRCPAAWH